jgi:hypothetical protein
MLEKSNAFFVNQRLFLAIFFERALFEYKLTQTHALRTPQTHHHIRTHTMRKLEPTQGALGAWATGNKSRILQINGGR